ncbi:acyltransferase family protein [Caballeronia insecticola]|uniref:Acyltransferase 3 n=1 Tax=Caballeronia insecticola TaxID=758793 RepID=R4WS56_9BURK|nr:acyltransferase [Caballeronia insecticola]BAN27429.1 acyltransferase 3 [Caballeronia insecticola]
MEKGRVAALDAGRALAIVGVVAVHLSFQFPNLPDAVTLIARMGQYGVQLFFVISAITIFMTLEMDHAQCVDARHVALRFYIKRFFRIAPMYYSAIAIYGLISYGATRSGIERAWILGAHGPMDVLLNMLFLHALSPTAINNVVPGGWSIGVEMLFYAIAPLLFFLAMDRTRLLIATVLLLGISLAVMSMSECNGTLDCNVANNTFSYFWPPVQGPCFIIGMWAWYGFRSHLLGSSDVTQRTSWLYFSLALIFALMTGALGVWLDRAHALTPVFAACSAVAFLLFVCSHQARKRQGKPRAAPRLPLVRRCAAALGRESYGIYLWHFVCVYITFHYLDRAFGKTSKEASLALFAVTLIAVLIVSYGLSRVSDRLIQGRATRLSKRLLASVDRSFHLTRKR